MVSLRLSSEPPCSLWWGRGRQWLEMGRIAGSRQGEALTALDQVPCTDRSMRGVFESQSDRIARSWAEQKAEKVMAAHV